MVKTLTVSDETWKRLHNLKMNHKLGTIDKTIVELMELVEE